MKEALKLALEALETERDIYRENDEDGAPEYILEAITVIEAALAQDEASSSRAAQEPAVFYRCNGCGHAYEQVHPTSCDCREASGFDRVEYFTTPPAAQPAQRPWEGLVNKEVLDFGDAHVTPEFARGAL